MEINIKAGDKYHLFSSYKYPVEHFQNIAKKAGLKPLDCFLDQHQPMVIHVLGVS